MFDGFLEVPLTVCVVLDTFETTTIETVCSSTDVSFIPINAAKVPRMPRTNHTMQESHELLGERLVLGHHSDTSATDKTLIQALEPDIARYIIVAALSTLLYHHLTDAANVLSSTHEEPATCLVLASTPIAVEGIS